MLLPLLDADTASLQINGLDKLTELAQTHSDVVGVLGALTGLVSVLLIFGMPVILVLIISAARTRRIRMQNEIVLRLAEQGHPVPPELFGDFRARRNSDLRSGLSMIGIGVGVAVGLAVAGGGEASGFALIPFFIGLARLIAWKMEQGSSTS